MYVFRLGADCGSNHEFLIVKFRLKLKKVGKTTRLFRYDLNQIPYNYTVEVTNRLKGLDLIDRVPEELWTEVHDMVQEAMIMTIPRTKKCKKVKCLSGEALQMAEKEAKGKGEKERHTHLNAELQRIARREKKAFVKDQCKEIEENNKMGKTNDLFGEGNDNPLQYSCRKIPWMEVCDIVQETGIKTIPMKRECEKAKWMSEETLQIAEKRREAKGKGEKERYIHLNAEFQRIARRDKKAFLGLP